MLASTAFTRFTFQISSKTIVTRLSLGHIAFYTTGIAGYTCLARLQENMLD